MEGFIVFDYQKEYPRALKDLAQWLSEGKIKRKETIVKGGIEQAQYALRDLYNGVNTGEYPYTPARVMAVRLTRNRQVVGRGEACRGKGQSVAMMRWSLAR